MPKVSVYLPEALYDSARKHGISVSTVAQQALQVEVRRHANIEWAEQVRARPPRVDTRIDTSALLANVRDDFGL